MLSSTSSTWFRFPASHSAGCILLLLSSFCINLNAQTLDPPSNVHALVYSSSAIELFFTPSDGTAVEILRNDSSLGVTDARSLFEAGLDSSLDYRYELRSVSEEGQRSIAVVIEATTGNFQLPVKRIDAVLVAASAEQIESDPPVLPQSIAEPVPNDEPDALADASADTLPESLPDLSADLQPEVLPAQAGACNVSSIADLRSCLDSSSSGGTVFVSHSMQQIDQKYCDLSGLPHCTRLHRTARFQHG